MVAVMKKFHGRRVARPMMKKMIHTALYLVERVEPEEVHATRFFCFLQQELIEMWLLAKCKRQPATHLSRGALAAVMAAGTVGGACLGG